MTWKNYDLLETPKSISNSDNMDLQTGQGWYAPEVDRKVLKSLMKRNNAFALMNYGIWLLLLIITALVVIATWGSMSGMLWLIVYSVIHQSATARQHELSHGTPFKTRLLNEVAFHICSFITLSEGNFYRWRHARHHTHTIIVGNDPEIQSPRPPNFLSLIINIFNIKTVIVTMKEFTRRSFGHLDSATIFIPPSEHNKVIWSARIYLFLMLIIVGTSLVLQSWLPIFLTFGPRILGAPLYAFLHFTQHAGLNEDVMDHRLNTRTIYMNPILQFLYANMNYHVEHHLFPLVPFYNLPKLHELIKDQCPKPKQGLIDAYREIIPTLMKQRNDPNFYLQPELPSA